MRGSFGSFEGETMIHHERNDHEQSELDPQPHEVRAPPTVRGVVPKQPAVWPTVIGVIAVVWAGMTLVGIPCGAAMWFIMPHAFESQSAAIFFGSQAIALALGIVLLVAGIGILQWRQIGVRFVTIWSIIALIWTPIGIMVGLIGADFEQGGNFGARMGAHFGILGVICGGLFTLALPIFLLIWFSRAAIKAETAEWKP
jgi:hypothetical protein